MDEKKRRKKIPSDKPTAAALKYEAGVDDAPQIVGLGVGIVAENMIATAQEHEVPIVEDAALAQTLQQLGIGDEIPEELYQVIAEIMVFIARMDGDQGARFGMS